MARLVARAERSGRWVDTCLIAFLGGSDKLILQGPHGVDLPQFSLARARSQPSQPATLIGDSVRTQGGKEATIVLIDAQSCGLSARTATKGIGVAEAGDRVGIGSCEPRSFS